MSAIDEERCDPEVVETMASLARRWMRGMRQGAGVRPSWEHPADVVALTSEVPVARDDAALAFMQAVAWGHDLIEDGVHDDGQQVSAEDLRRAGIPEPVVRGVVLLTKEPGITPDLYYGRLCGASERVRIVKCCDRIANLREAITVFTEPRWQKYVRETEGFTKALTTGMAAPHGPWLLARMDEAIARRGT
jgi:hypothetical protein